MALATTCTNPRCSCSPCMCGEGCQCGGIRLGDLERRVMAVLWEAPDVARTGRYVSDALPDHAYTTVATVLDRLSRKGLVYRRKEGRTNRYVAVASEEVRTAGAIRQLLQASHDPEAALSHFVESASSSERKALRRALTESPRWSRSKTAAD